MSFVSPIAFWFAAVLPVVILFYLLKRKRVVRLVSSTLLWRKFLAETQASAPFQKLRHHWLLILQLLLLILVILALARPYFAASIPGGRLLVMILDGSASMQSTDESPSRFEKARAEALKWIDSMHDDDQTVVLLAAAQTEVKQSPTREKAAARRALQSSAPSDSPTRLVEALKLAETLVKDHPKPEIHLFSDGAVPGLNELENKNLPLTYHRVGQRANNLAIISLDARAHPENPAQRAIFVSVANYSTNQQSADLELRFNDQLLETKILTLRPGETTSEVFVAAQAEDGVFSLRLNAPDDLASDNEGAMVSMLPRPVKVLLLSQGNRFLEKALRAVQGVDLSMASDLSEVKPAFDLVVLDDLAPAVWPSVNLLAINTAPTNWFEARSKLEAPVIVDWKNTHSLLRFVTFDNVQIAASWAVKTPSWALPLLEAPQSPLILAGELARQRIVWIGFDLLESTWPLRVSFPIFIANAVEWLNPAVIHATQLTVKAGDPFRLALSEPAAEAQIILPNGSAKSMKLDPNAREIIFGGTAQRGIYRMQAGTNRAVFCVNLLDPAESDTTPRAELQLGKYAKVSATVMRRANLEIWRWIALAGLGVLMFEWWYYHRRTA